MKYRVHKHMNSAMHTDSSDDDVCFQSETPCLGARLLVTSGFVCTRQEAQNKQSAPLAKNLLVRFIYGLCS